MRRAALATALVALVLASRAGPMRGDSAPGRAAAVFAADSAADSTAVRLTFLGRVTGARGKPLASARVAIDGSRKALATTDATGAYSISLSLGDLDALRSPIELWLDARTAGYRIRLSGGAPRLRLEIRAPDHGAGAPHVLVRSNDRMVTAQLARAVKDGALDDTLRVDFVAAPGKALDPRHIVMNQAEDVAIPRRSAPTGALPPAAASGPGSSAPDAASSTASAASSAPGSSSVPSLDSPPPRVPIPVPLPASRVLADTAGRAARPSPERDSLAAARGLARDSCECRIDGTIEVRSDRTLPEPVPVGLWLDEEPARRDSVELLLGSPQVFQLWARGCGTHRIQFETYSRLRFSLLSELPQVDCTRRGPQQIRIVLTPAGRIRSSP